MSANSVSDARNSQSRGSLRLQRPTLFHYTASRDWLLQASETLFADIANGVLKVDPSNSFPLRDVAAAHDQLEGRQTTGSTVLIP